MSSSRDFRDLDGADPWTLLGVRRDADADEIRRSYRRLSRSHHTDVGGDASHQAKLNRAYEILSDPARRAGYAQLLDGPPEPPPIAEPAPDEPPADPFEWTSGPTPTYTPPPRQPYTDPFIAPPYQQTPYQQPTYQDIPDPYVAPPYRGPYTEQTQKRGVNAKAIAALPTALFCMPLSIILAFQALRTMRWSGERGKTLAWIALIVDVLAMAYFIGLFR
ncbi:MAG TPA: DnaJ domain-containing protein [Kribbella sp.]|nr:DnaJ domain-containing protein [Kribbella sp.]